MTHLEKVRELRARTDIHFNCCQSVLVTFAREMGLTEQQAFDMGANFGSGMSCGSALLKASHDAGIPRKEHCDGLVFEVVEALE